MVFSPTQRYHGITLVSMLALAALLISQAGVTADAYVTFRVVDNAVHGYGLRWNVAERVEVYTHPLWMLLHIPFYALWENIFAITIGLSVLCTLGALLITIYTFHKPLPQTLALLIIPLAISSTFIVSSTLGLENPLTHMLFALFGWALLRAKRYRWFWLSFACSLSMVNRLDTIVFYAPILLYLLVSCFRSISLAQCLLGGLPIVLWEAFSLFYYGFALPNTAYAKLPHALLDPSYLKFGLYYLLNLISLDITSAAFLVCIALVVPLAALCRKSTYPPEMVAIACGVLCYCLYVIMIGGTYISGRFWSLPVVASLWVFYAMESDRMSQRTCMWLASFFIALGLAYPSPDLISDSCPACFKETQLRWYYVTAHGFPHNIRRPNEIRPLPRVYRGGSNYVAMFGGVGFSGYSGGPAAYNMNPFAFTDPLLAHLPSIGTSTRMRQLQRNIPAGYEDAIKTGSLDTMDPSLAQYYAKLRLIITGDLFDRQRLIEIVKFNRGDYDYLRDAYLHPKGR